MKTTKTYLILMVLGIILFACKKEYYETIVKEYNDTTIVIEAHLDKQIIIPLVASMNGFTGGEGVRIFSTPLVNFNKNDYHNIDSISLVLSDLSVENSFGVVTLVDTLKIELYDYANKTSLGSSKIFTNYISPSDYLASPNIYYTLPDTAMNLGIKITNTKTLGYYYEIRSAILVLVRK